MNIYERIFERLEKLGIDPRNIPEYAKSKSGGYMDLNLDRLYVESDHTIIALSHYSEQEGDLVPDPDMQVRIYPDTKMAEALTYQDTYTYTEVYPGGDTIDTKAKKDLNQFLFTWLTNCINQGHSFKEV